MTDYLSALRSNIKYYREKQQISQTQLAIFCDCGTGTIGGIESGKAKPSVDMLLRLAEALKVTPADLFICDVSKSKETMRQELRTLFDSFLATL